MPAKMLLAPESRAHSEVPSTPTRGAERTFVALLAIAFAISGASSARAQSPPHTHGQWSDTTDVGINGVNVAVLRDSATDQTRVLLYGSQGVNLKLGQWALTPRYDQQDPVLTGGAQSFFSIPTTYPPDDIFCSGLSSFADGRLLITGGEHAPGVGIEKTYIWNPNASVTAALQAGPIMAQERWYPSNLSMDDGKILTFAGSRWGYMLAFGGTTGSALNDFRPLALGTRPGTWKWWDPQPTGGPPTAREDHAACLDPNGRMFVFGGDDNGSSGNGKRNDVWMLYRTPAPPDIRTDSTWAWVDLNPSGDPTHGVPTARSDHTAVLNLSDSSIVIYGGRDTNEVALQDVWRLKPAGAGWQWERVMATSSPGARYGHTATYFPGSTGAGADATARMMVSGGWNGTSGP